jgi:molybdenum cofactor sulfurtransferase
MLFLDVQKGICGTETQVNASRFRPNLVVSGGRPYDEDGWRDIRIGNQYFRVSSNNLLKI